MKIEIKGVTPKEIEMANFMLARAAEMFTENSELADSWRITKKDIAKAGKFRKQLLKAFLK